MEGQFFKKYQDPENPDFERVINSMVERDFTPQHELRTQEEIQRKWDETKEKQSAKFDPKNLEQKELFD